jgi:hypothetical protein
MLADAQIAAVIAGQARKMPTAAIPQPAEAKPATFAMAGHDGKSRIRKVRSPARRTLESPSSK